MNPLFWVALVATIFYALTLALFLALHLSRSGYTIHEHAVSDYAVGKTGRLFTLYGWTGNLGALALAHLFFYSSRPAFPPSIALLLLLMVAARIGLILFRTDLEGETRTRSGVLHYLFAVINFALAYTVIDNATPFLAAQPGPLGPLLSLLQYVVLVSLVGVVVTVFRPLRRFFGVIERIFLLSTTLWFFLASLAFVLLNRA